MAEIKASIRHNIAGLTRFSGRDTRAQYWPWAIMLLILDIIAGMFAAAPMLSHMMARFANIFAAASHGDKLPPEAVDAQFQGMATTMTADMRTMIFAGIAIHLVFTLLILAATVRRLHDRDWRGWWALLPLPFQAAGAAMAPRLLADFRMPHLSDKGPVMPLPVNSPLMGLNTLTSLAFYCALGFLVFLLVTEGTRGPNRFGVDPLGR